MPVQQLLQTISERLGASANARNVYGEPVAVGEKTILPVARITHGFGGGMGHRNGDEIEGRESGGGGGGGMNARPVGVLEITPQQTRFVPVNETGRLAAAALAGFGAGLLWAWRSNRR